MLRIRLKFAALLCGLAMSLMLCACVPLDLANAFEVIKKEIPVSEQKISQNYKHAGKSNSTYGYEQLDENEKILYNQLVKAWSFFETSIVTKQKITRGNLLEISELVFHDYPEICWVERYFTCQPLISGATKISMKYVVTADKAKKFSDDLNKKLAQMLSDIDPSLSDFEKASIAHDKLINAVSYDKQAEFPSDAYGAIVQNRATCLGYAKAYQLMLLKMGIETLVVYGDAQELHAWNYVKLGTEFYFVDTTFDDAKTQDGLQYISRAYLFLNDAQSLKTHTPLNNGGYKKLPPCNNTSKNYFVQKKLLINNENLSKSIFNKLLRETAKSAIEQKAEAFQIKAESEEIAKQIDLQFVAKGTADVVVNNAASIYRGVDYIGRTFEDKTNVYTFVLSYK